MFSNKNKSSNKNVSGYCSNYLGPLCVEQSYGNKENVYGLVCFDFNLNCQDNFEYQKRMCVDRLKDSYTKDIYCNSIVGLNSYPQISSHLPENPKLF
jgi:hypothetical protein